MAKQRREQFIEQIEVPEERLAAEVLKRAVIDNDFSSTGMLEFWCDAAGVEPDAFFDQGRRNGGIF